MLYQDYRKVVEQAASNWFAREGRSVDQHRPYILAEHKQWAENLIDPQILPLVESVRPRHTFVHHGLSSQALCFSLFGSLLLRHDLGALADVFARAGAPWPEGECAGQFEFDDRSVFR